MISIDRTDRQDGFPAVGVSCLVLAAIAGGIAFSDGIRALLVAWQLPEYSHGPLIPLISGYLFLRQMKGVPPRPGEAVSRGPGVALAAIALALGVLGTLTGIDDLAAYGLILWAGAVVLISFGWARGRQFWPPVLHLAFMLPLPAVLYFKTSLALQFVSSEIGVSIIRGAGIPVYLDGNIIDLDVYKLHVAEACSGLRYLFPMMSFTYIFAVLYQGPLWIKAILLLAAVPIAVAMNAIRVGVIGIMVDAYGIEHAEGFMHLFEGWVVFGLCVALTVALAWALKRLCGDRRSLLQVLDIDMSGLGAQMARVRDVAPSRALVGASLAVALLGATAHVAPGLTPKRPAVEREPLALFPHALGDWRAPFHGDLEPRIVRALRADDYLTTRFEAPDAAQPVDLFVAWYEDQGQGGVHSPEICLPAGGWEMSAIRVETVMAGSEPIEVNRVVIQKGLTRQLVYYWLEQRGRRITSEYEARVALLWDRVTTGRTDGGIVRLITPIGEDESVAVAQARLDAFLAEAVGALPAYLGAGDAGDETADAAPGRAD